MLPRLATEYTLRQAKSRCRLPEKGVTYQVLEADAARERVVRAIVKVVGPVL